MFENCFILARKVRRCLLLLLCFSTPILSTSIDRLNLRQSEYRIDYQRLRSSSKGESSPEMIEESSKNDVGYWTDRNYMEVHSPVQQSLSQASSRQRQLADSSSSSSQSTSTSSQEFELPLSPFQLHLDLNTSSAMSSGEEMMLLSVTQAYLSSVLKQIEPNFSRLALYQFVRDFHNLYYSKVASRR